DLSRGLYIFAKLFAAGRRLGEDLASMIFPESVALSALVFSVSATAAPAVGVPTKFNWDATRYVYAFGDSYTFVEGTKGLATFSFIGDAFDFSFTPAELLEDEIVPKNTSSDGSNWVEFLTGCFEGKPSDCSPHQLWDFAFAGADIDKSLLPLHHNFTIDLVDEVKRWAAYAADVIPHPAHETLTAWWIGINDTGDTLNNATITDIHAFWETEMASFFSAVELAYDRNLRGTYLFINVPPEDRSPSHANTSWAATLAANIDDYNAVLDAHVQDFAATHSDMNVLTFDAHAWFNGVLDSPSQFGFTNITGFCECTDPGFFWYSECCWLLPLLSERGFTVLSDTGHPTEHVHRLLAQAIEEELRRASAVRINQLPRCGA
ncbi:hypothetical protein A0H81_08770, partial [Grifola frondosa]